MSSASRATIAGTSASVAARKITSVGTRITVDRIDTTACSTTVGSTTTRQDVGESAVSASPVLVSPSRLLDPRLEELVAAELDRLSRRAPALADDHLGLVEASLQRIINRLLPARGRASAPPEAVAALFDLEFV